MKFQDSTKVLATINASNEVERWRGENRAKINNMANGLPPISEDKAKKMGLRCNANWGEMAVLFQHGRRQYSNAFQGRSTFFKVTIPTAPIQEKLEWEQFITQHLNRVMKKSRKYYEQGRSIWASVVPHGIGPSLWEDADCWCPDYVALEDLRIPTDTKVNLENLEWFAVRKNYTPGELARKVFGNNASANWDKPTIKKLLHEYHDKAGEQPSDTWLTAPEKMWELYKQNLGFYTSDAVPTIPLWHFFYRDEENPKKSDWRLLVVPTDEVRGQSGEYKAFLYKSKKAFALDISHILHLQIGDLNNKPPFLYHSVRSLGFLLMEPIFWRNLLRCRTLQHVFEHMNVWLRFSDPTGRGRAQKAEFYDKAVVPEGVTIVPQTERHQIDLNLVSGTMAELDGLIEEASASYTQDMEGPSGKPETATAVMARMTAVNAMMSGLLSTAFRYETFKYQEICRRFCRRKSSDADVKRFQAACIRRGIPSVYLNSDLWDVEPEIPMGAGNPTMEMAQAQQLLGMRPMFDPASQQEILHEATVAITGDSRKADRWVPLKKQGPTSGQEWATAIFGTLMQGVPVPYKREIPVIDLIESLLGMAGGVIARIEEMGNVPEPFQLTGLQTVSQYIGGLVAQMAQNEQEKQRVKEYEDALGNINNLLKAFAQRLQEQNAQNNGHPDPEAIAKAQALTLQAQTKAEISQATAMQKMEQKQLAWEQKMQQDFERHMADLQKKLLDAQTDTAIKLSAPRKETATE